MQYNPPDNEAGGIVSDAPEGTDLQMEQMSYYDKLLQRLSDAQAATYGQNAAQRWSGTPAVGFAATRREQPVYRYDWRGRPIQMIEAGTRFAEPPQGLIGGKAFENQQRYGVASSFTPTNEWEAQFKPQMKFPGSGGSQQSWSPDYPKAGWQGKQGPVFHVDQGAYSY